VITDLQSHLRISDVRMDLRETGWGGLGWGFLTQDRNQWRVLVNMVMNPRVPYNFWNFLNRSTTGGSSRRAQLRGVSLVN
jgi:hypothetical protein